jgi:site-specific recombinase XerD
MAYMYDLRRFLSWLKSSIPDLKNKQLKDITIDIIDSLTINDINEYKSYLEINSDNPNGPRGKARKLASLNSLFDFLYRSQYIDENPLAKQHARHRKTPKTPIIRLQPDEAANFLDKIEYGSEHTTERQAKFLGHTKVRDLAIVTTLLGTGMRVSECVGLDIEDVNFKELKILLHRKGAKEQFISMSDEVIQSLSEYLAERKQIQSKPGDEHALFLSNQKRRICTRSVENLVKKYAKLAGITKNISPHKLRKTYGTELYNQTGDIYLVARVLGHNNVNTTKDHYILDDENSLIQTRNVVKLRK